MAKNKAARSDEWKLLPVIPELVAGMTWTSVSMSSNTL